MSLRHLLDETQSTRPSVPQILYARKHVPEFLSTFLHLLLLRMFHTSLRETLALVLAHSVCIQYHHDQIAKCVTHQ